MITPNNYSPPSRAAATTFFSTACASPFGGSIPERIEEEQAHNSVLLGLETFKVHRSTWVIREIATAATNRMAILALNFPDAPHLPVLINRRRLPLTPTDLTANKRLNTAALKRICDRVAVLQDFWLTRRRFQLQSSLSKVLLKEESPISNSPQKDT